MANRQSPHCTITWPVREFLALANVSFLHAAGALNQSVNTLLDWVRLGQSPLIVYKALLALYDPEGRTDFADPTVYGLRLVNRPPRLEPVTLDLAARWDARHVGLVLTTTDGTRIRVCDPGRQAKATSANVESESPAEASSIPSDPSPPTSVDSAPVSLEPADAPVASMGPLPPESQILLRLLVEVARVRDEVAAERDALHHMAQREQARSAELERNNGELLQQVATLRDEAAGWQCLAEEAERRATAGPPEQAVDSVRSALAQQAPQLLGTLEGVLGNWQGPSR